MLIILRIITLRKVKNTVIIAKVWINGFCYLVMSQRLKILCGGKFGTGSDLHNYYVGHNYSVIVQRFLSRNNDSVRYNEFAGNTYFKDIPISIKKSIIINKIFLRTSFLYV